MAAVLNCLAGFVQRSTPRGSHENVAMFQYDKSHEVQLRVEAQKTSDGAVFAPTYWHSRTLKKM